MATAAGQPSAGELFGKHVFENLSIVCCTQHYLAAHPHDWQSYDGCRTPLAQAVLKRGEMFV